MLKSCNTALWCCSYFIVVLEVLFYVDGFCSFMCVYFCVNDFCFCLLFIVTLVPIKICSCASLVFMWKVFMNSVCVCNYDFY